MLKENKASQNHITNISGVATGLFFGSLIGAVTMLLMAPQSGKRTRVRLQQKSIELRDRANEMVEDNLMQVRTESKKLTRSGRQKARELMQRGQELVSGQLTHVSHALGTGKKAILGS